MTSPVCLSMIITAETLLSDAKILPSRSGLSSDMLWLGYSLYSIDQRPVFPGILLQWEAGRIQMLRYFPLPYEFAVFDLLDSVCVDIAVWRFLHLSSGKYENSLYRVYHLEGHLRWLLAVLRDQDRGNDHHPRRSSYLLSACRTQDVTVYRLLVMS